MKIEKKSYYFIKDKYFEFANDPYLLKNKDNGNSRPCFLVEYDNNQIIWLIPISSKIEKYRKLYNFRISKYKYCNTIVFGEFLEKDCVFLIQNMFPISKKYIANKYVKDKTPVKIDKKLEEEITRKFNEVLKLVRKGRKGIVFPDVLKIEKLLLK